MNRTLVFCFLFAMSTIANCAWSQTADERLTRLFDQAWEYDVSSDPLHATSVGDHRFNDQLPDVSVAANEDRIRQKKQLLEQLHSIDRTELSPTQRLNFDIFDLLLKNEITEGQFETYLIPITNRSGFQIYFPDQRTRVPLKTVKDYQNYIQRLEKFREYAQGHIALMRKGIAAGLTLPSVVLEGYRESIEPHVVDDVTKSLMYEPIRSIPESFSDDEKSRIDSACRTAIRDGIVAGYRDFLTFMEKEYVPAARGSIAASALPNGREYYRYCVRKFTTLDVTPEQVHETGLSEVKRIRSEMEAIKAKVQFDGSLSEFMDSLRKDPRFHPTSAEHLMKEVSYTLKKIDGRLPELFKTLPRTPYGIRPIPDYIAPRTTTAYYMPPPGDRSLAGFYYVNTYDLKSRPLYEIEALSLHEAVPGHHLQIALQQELENVPNFRRFAGFTAFVEGWALYAERLGLEVGFYEDPYSDFGRLTYEMWRACRLVVDTGMHYLGWTRQQAIDFMAENTALSLHNIRSEVDRYIAWPGQALAYKTGELKIRELRARAEKELGDKFDVREFHDIVLLQGSIPLDILEQNVDAWIRGVSF
ncbi:MAG: DUF885 domain-containing protein [Planctomycetales bacterium]|nr:DUF885 domain-containing protein [Planctomycetales bacterium]